MGPGDSKYREYKDYAIGQIEYLSGRNPRNRSYIGGFGPNFPRRIHHRAANNDTQLRSGAPDDQYVLHGALVSGPDANDNYSNDRTNHRQTEPTLAPNGFLTILAAQLVKEYNLGDSTQPPSSNNSNAVRNSSFENGTDNWQLWTHSSANANLNNQGNTGNVTISNGGSEDYHVQLRQRVNLRRGFYALSFRGQSDRDRLL